MWLVVKDLECNAKIVRSVQRRDDLITVITVLLNNHILSTQSYFALTVPSVNVICPGCICIC